MKTIKICTLLLIISLLSTTGLNIVKVQAKELQDIFLEEPMTIGEDEKIIYISDEVIKYAFKPNKGGVSVLAEYPIYTRLLVYSKAGPGFTSHAKKFGTYYTIATTLLGFSKYASSMSVQSIFAAVGLLVGSDTYVQAETKTSYTDFRKEAEARWADETTYSAWVASGKRNFYKHVIAGYVQTNNVWLLETKNYPTAVYSDTGNYYNNSTDWFLTQASQRIQNGLFLDDLPW